MILVGSLESKLFLVEFLDKKVPIAFFVERRLKSLSEANSVGIIFGGAGLITSLLFLGI